MAWPNVFDIDVAQLKPTAAAPASLPTIILVHDAFSSPDHLQQLAGLLRTVGRHVLTPELISTDGTFVTGALQADVQAVFECGRAIVENGQDIVMVLHGYAAIPGALASERLNRHSLEVPRAGEVTKMILVAGVVLAQSESYLSLLRPDWLAIENGLCHIINPSQVLFHDCGLETARSAAEILRPQNADTVRLCAPASCWSTIPTVYVACDLSRAVPSRLQHAFFARLQAANRRARLVQLQTGHSPYLSKPRELAAIVLQAATG